MAKGFYYGLEIHDLDKYKTNRDNYIAYKGGALNTQIDELDGILNLTKFSRRFFKKSQSWFSQRIHGSLVMNKEMSFKSDELKQISLSYRVLQKPQSKTSKTIVTRRMVDKVAELVKELDPSAIYTIESIRFVNRSTFYGENESVGRRRLLLKYK